MEKIATISSAQLQLYNIIMIFPIHALRAYLAPQPVPMFWSDYFSAGQTMLAYAWVDRPKIGATSWPGSHRMPFLTFGTADTFWSNYFFHPHHEPGLRRQWVEEAREAGGRPRFDLTGGHRFRGSERKPVGKARFSDPTTSPAHGAILPGHQRCRRWSTTETTRRRGEPAARRVRVMAEWVLRIRRVIGLTGARHTGHHPVRTRDGTVVRCAPTTYDQAEAVRGRTCGLTQAGRMRPSLTRKPGAG